MQKLLIIVYKQTKDGTIVSRLFGIGDNHLRESESWPGESKPNERSCSKKPEAWLQEKYKDGFKDALEVEKGIREAIPAGEVWSHRVLDCLLCHKPHWIHYSGDERPGAANYLCPGSGGLGKVGKQGPVENLEGWAKRHRQSYSISAWPIE